MMAPRLWNELPVNIIYVQKVFKDISFYYTFQLPVVQFVLK